MKHIFIDFEMNPVDKGFKKERRICAMEIIEIGAVMLDDSLKEISSFKRYVKPQFSSEILERFVELTGITTDMIKDKEHFPEAFAAFVDWCVENTDPEEEYTVYAWSETDLYQLEGEIEQKSVEITDEMDYIMENWVDFQREFGRIVGISKQISLEKALDLAGLRFDGQIHDALWDARNTAMLFAHTEDDESFQATLDKIHEVLQPPKPMTVSLGDFLLKKGVKLDNE
ncbi:MAG: exonuclease domain-containing protein [Firmicutes bacterium]|nr:exonuclease domain-containing protein [Bacillota bacterium]